ncbi:unnamed protein product [Cylicocyclus nassatus]|uniref:Uncharacterized protein n=1 Tax=Cylicocyclus nassatus TaxID=53992 RepID=A0AA36GP73_CYLNA|nr:unnamed protein product [Cylicocyclus nassatus]
MLERSHDPIMTDMIKALAEKVPKDFSAIVEDEIRARSFVISGVEEPAQEWTLPEKIYSHQGLKTKKTHQSKVECAKWNDCDTCILSVFSFADHQMDKVKGDRLKQVCNLVSTHVGDSKPLKVCDTVLREVVANKAIFRKMQEYKAKGLNMKWFCAEELSKPYCTSKVPQ